MSCKLVRITANINELMYNGIQESEAKKLSGKLVIIEKCEYINRQYSTEKNTAWRIIIGDTFNYILLKRHFEEI